MLYVAINHNGSGQTSLYEGRLIVVVTTEGNDQLTTLSITVVMLCFIPHAEMQQESHTAIDVVAIVLPIVIVLSCWVCVCAVTCTYSLGKGAHVRYVVIVVNCLHILVT